MEMVRNPSLMQEMMRTHDRALSNLEVCTVPKLCLQFINDSVLRQASSLERVQIVNFWCSFESHLPKWRMLSKCSFPEA